jgi:hypothetical protein
MSSAAYANDITGKLEDAARAMLQAAVTAGTITTIASANIYAGCDSETLATPRILCVCDSADVEEIFDGNWSATLDVYVIANANDTTRDAFREMCGQAFISFFQQHDDVCSDLSNATIEFTAQAVYPRRQEKSRITDQNSDEWEGKLTLTVKCCGSVIP